MSEPILYSVEYVYLFPVICYGHSDFQIPISKLGLSVRSRKAMLRLEITTVGELLKNTAEDLLESKNFGQVCLTEVREKLAKIGYRLRAE